MASPGPARDGAAPAPGSLAGFKSVAEPEPAPSKAGDKGTAAANDETRGSACSNAVSSLTPMAKDKTFTSTPSSAPSEPEGDDSQRTGFAKVMPALFGLFGFKIYKPVYTIADIEKKIYDIQHHDSGTRLLQQRGIISVDDDEIDEEENDVHSRVIRCFTDSRAKYAALALIANVLCTCFMTPLSFIWGGTWSDKHVRPRFLPGGRALLVADIVMDVLYAGYLLLQLNMSFMHSTRRVEVTARSKILRRWLLDPLYITRWISTTAYFWIAVCDAPMLINNIKLVRVAHLLSFPDALWLIQDDGMVRLARVLFLLMGCSHWVACLLVWGGGYQEVLLDSSVETVALTFKGETLPHTGHLKLYLMALVESIYMLTGALDNPLGEGGARENNLGSLILVSVFGPIGCVVVAVLIAAVCREQALKFALEIRHEENMAFVTRALENLNIPAELQRRVVSLHYFQKMSHDFEAFSQLFKKNNLSGPLEDAIRVYLYNNVLRSPFFTSGGPNYLLAVVRVLEDRMYLPGDYVARRGEVGEEMFFVNRGELCVLVAGRKNRESISGAVPIAGRKRKGSYFGEVALLKRSLRTAWVRAETYVVVSVLHRTSIEEIWEYFPREREALVKTVMQTVERDKQRNNRQRWQNAIEFSKSEASLGNGSAFMGAPVDVPESNACAPSSPSDAGEAAAAAQDPQGPPPFQAAGASHAAKELSETVQALAEQEEKHHQEALELSKSQGQRLEDLERQVSKLVSLLEDDRPASSSSRGKVTVTGFSKSTKKRTDAVRPDQVAWRVVGEAKPDESIPSPPRGSHELSSLEKALVSSMKQEQRSGQHRMPKE